jgi:hypothetical protein
MSAPTVFGTSPTPERNVELAECRDAMLDEAYRKLPSVTPWELCLIFMGGAARIAKMIKLAPSAFRKSVQAFYDAASGAERGQS